MFTQWLLAQKERDDAVGDLAQDALEDGTGLTLTTVNQWQQHLFHAPRTVFRAFWQARNEYSRAKGMLNFVNSSGDSATARRDASTGDWWELTIAGKRSVLSGDVFSFLAEKGFKEVVKLHPDCEQNAAQYAMLYSD